MAARVSNLDLFNRADAATNEAADKLTLLADGHRERGLPLTVPQINAVRKLLREAYCATHELKQRLKAEPQLRPTKGKL